MFQLETMTFNANISFLFNLSKRLTFVQYISFSLQVQKLYFHGINKLASFESIHCY